MKSIENICRATCFIKEIRDNFDNNIKLHQSSTRHTERSSYNDELEMIKDLQGVNPFDYIPGRKHDSFPDIKRSPLLYLNQVEHNLWLLKHMKEINQLLFSDMFLQFYFNCYLQCTKFGEF